MQYEERVEKEIEIEKWETTQEESKVTKRWVEESSRERYRPTTSMKNGPR